MLCPKCQFDNADGMNFCGKCGTKLEIFCPQCNFGNPSGYEFLIIDHNNFDAAFALHGGHLVHFQLRGQQPIIWTSKTAIYNDQKAIRGGVPVCWPWLPPAPAPASCPDRRRRPGSSRPGSPLPVRSSANVPGAAPSKPAAWVSIYRNWSSTR